MQYTPTVLLDRFLDQLRNYDDRALQFLVDGYHAAWEVEVASLIENELTLYFPSIHEAFDDRFTNEQFRKVCLDLFYREGRILLDEHLPEDIKNWDRQLVRALNLQEGDTLERYGVPSDDLIFYRSLSNDRRRK